MDKTKIIILLLCSIIIGAAIVIGSAVSASTLAERPLTGSFSGSLTSSSSYDTDITTTDGLMSYLGMFPSNPNMDYEAEMREHRDKLEENILSGKWPDFPYVKIGDEMYFSIDAVKDWFTEKGKTQLVIE